MTIRGVNFSYKCTKGSVDTRNKKVGQICEQTFSKLVEEFRKNKSTNIEQSSVSFLKIQELIKEVLPEPINFYVAKWKTDAYSLGSIKQIISCNSVVCYRMELPLNNKNLSIENIPTFMHELTHLLDDAINPQQNIVLEKIYKKNPKKSHNYIMNYIITVSTTVKKKLLKKQMTF